MRHIIFILLFCLSIVSCGEETSGSAGSSKSSAASSSQVSKDSLDQINVAIDSLKTQINYLSAQVDSLNQSLQKVQNEKKSYLSTPYIIAYVCVLIVIAGICYIVCHYPRNRKSKDFSNEFDSLRRKYNELNENLGSVRNETNKGFESVQKDITDINARLSKSENSPVKKQDKIKTQKTKEEAKTYYFGNILGATTNYFLDIYESPKDEAVFKASLNGERGTFELRNINMYTSSETNEKAIKITPGNVIRDEATGFKTIKPGTVHKGTIDNQQAWIMDSPTVIELTK